eukprot:XP_012810880.2 PREDICTED: uncharacterized protein LOC105946141 [Xenopus tropicalis]
MRGLALLLLLGALRGCLLQNIRVSQIPAVSATEGSTVTLQCHYTLSSTENGTLGWYRWYRHVLGGPEVSNNSGNFTGRVSRACQSDCQSEFIYNRSASIQLHRVRIPDTGMYICEVTLGLNKTLQGHGNGTFLNVAGCLLQNIQVSQIPAVSATEGSTVTLQCHYTLSSTENGSLGWYRWYRHVLGGPEVSNNSGHFTGRVSSACQSDCQNEFINNRSASIQLHRVQIPDTGMYICEVTLGLNKTLQGHGNGTFLNVAGEILLLL